MTVKVDIFGCFIDSEFERTDANDITPNIFKDSVSELNEGDTLEMHMNSVGGNCTSGIAIANMVRALKNRGVKTVCVVDGVCASIATLPAMACDELKMYPSSFIMIHNPWSIVQGDAETLRKEAVSLDAMKAAILSFYHEKFDLTDDELTNYMNQETWISGQDKDTYKLNATLLDEVSEYRMSARMMEKIEKRFNNKSILEKFKMMEETDNTEETKNNECQPEETQEKAECVVEETPKTDEPKNEETTEVINEETITEEVREEVEEKQPTVEELQAIIEELKKKIAELESEKEMPVEDRISKCQSVFQNKINNFKNELKAKDEELQKFKDSVSSLNSELEETKKELQNMSAAFEEKTTALAKLNASVLSPKKDTTDWRSLKGDEFIKWAESHKDEIKQNKIN